MAAKQVFDDLKRMNNQGLTIIEVLFALSIFAIGILAVSSLTIASINSNSSSRRVTEATTLAEDRLERLMTQPYEDIIDGQEEVGAYDVSWTIIENEIADMTKSVTVTVTV